MFYIWDSDHFQQYKDIDLTKNQTIVAKNNEKYTLSQFKDDIDSGIKYTPQIKLCTDSFSVQSCDLIINWLNYKFDIKSHKRQHRKTDPNKNFRIIINTEDAYKFLQLIKPHIIPSMLYKVDYEEYKKYRQNKNNIAEKEF